MNTTIRFCDGPDCEASVPLGDHRRRELEGWLTVWLPEDVRSKHETHLCPTCSKKQAPDDLDAVFALVRRGLAQRAQRT